MTLKNFKILLHPSSYSEVRKYLFLLVVVFPLFFLCISLFVYLAWVSVPQKQDSVALFSAILYECVTQENPEMLPTLISIDQVKTL